jgi:membrane-associated protease RseP (regulator of RpoE activity)
VLDGGRIFFILLGGLLGLFGRRLRPEQELSASYVGMMLLLLLFVLVTINDIRRLAGG